MVKCGSYIRDSQKHTKTILTDLLAQALRSRDGEGKEKQQGTKRSFHAYNLLTWGPKYEEGWRMVSHAGVEADVRLAPAATSPSLNQLVGFSNTGTCVSGRARSA